MITLQKEKFRNLESKKLKKKKKVLGRSDKINSLIEKYRTMLSKFIDNGRFRNDIVELWFKCLIILNIINTDF